MRAAPNATVRTWLALLAAVLGVGTLRTAHAQAILVAPMAGATTDRTRTGALTLINTGDRDTEIPLSTAYGYPVTDAAAAAWRIRGVLGVSGGVTLTLPTVLTRVGGTETMPVTFCGTCGAYRINSGTPAGATAFDPSTGVQGLYVVVLSDVYVWLGGAVTSPPNQTPGNCVGTVSLTVSALL
ncbi:MAG: hypothetical protein M3154_05175 [Candidatus Eremiobacteraeota bacterium]|nr:hypothetical protein [Candidatus Eremiobacteraeota bacterium]